jgi:hypothetical protein
MPDGPRRILAVLECRASDDAVLREARAVADESGGWLTLVAIPPTRFPFVNAGPYCSPGVTCEELHAHAEAVLRRAIKRVGPDIPLIAAIEEGRPRDVIARRVGAAAHDLVVARRCRLQFRPWSRSLPVPLLAAAD